MPQPGFFASLLARFAPGSHGVFVSANAGELASAEVMKDIRSLLSDLNISAGENAPAFLNSLSAAIGGGTTGGIQLKELNLSLTPDQATICLAAIRIGIDVSIPCPAQVLEGHFKLNSSPTLYVLAYNPAAWPTGWNRWEAWVEADAEVFDVASTISVSVRDKIVTLHLKLNEQGATAPSAQALATSFGVQNPGLTEMLGGTLAPPLCSWIGIQVDLTSKSYYANLTIDEPISWHKLTLKEISVDLNYTGIMMFSVSSVATIAGIDLKASLSNDGNGGLAMSAEGDVRNPPSLGDFLSELTHQLGLPDPGPLPFDLALDHLAVSLVRSDNTITYFSASCAGTISFEGAAAPTAVALEIQKTGNDLQGVLDVPAQSGVTFAKIVDTMGSAFGRTGLGAEMPGIVADVAIKGMTFGFNAASGAQPTKEFSAVIDVSAPLSGDASAPQLDVRVELRRGSQGICEVRLSGTLAVGSLKFAVEFEKAAGATEFVAVYQNEGGGKVDVSSLLSGVGPLAEVVPSGLSFSLKDALIAYNKAPSDPAAQLLFVADVGAGADLSGLGDLPLLGKYMPRLDTLSLGVTLGYASAPVPGTVLGSWQGILPDGAPALPQAPAAAGSGGAVALPKGLTLGGALRIGDVVLPITLPVSLSQQGNALQPSASPAAISAPGSNGGAPAGGGATAGAHITWFKLQRAFGPLEVTRVGLSYDSSKGKIDLYLDASLSALGLTLSLIDLEADVVLSLDSPDPSFHLRGIGIDFRKGALEIGGGLLVAESNGIVEYDGAADIKTSTLSLSALASYAECDGSPSMFVYAVLDYPIGGPAFFFVNGLAAGFGYYRRIAMPVISRVQTFPLVQQAINTPSPKPSPADAVALLKEYISPSPGDYFIAAGIRFSTFKQIESFALLNVSFGSRELEVDLLGLSGLSIPSPDEGGGNAAPLAFVQIALLGRFIPAEGFLGVQGQLTPASFVLSNNCLLQGGFAFFSWFKGPHAGDFVVSVGGYHPQFRKPDWYPDVPRLGFIWRIDRHTQIKGGSYFAFTPSALMVGGNLDATWESGDISAWFQMGMDCLIAWKPYHYEASAYVEIGVQLTVHCFGTHHVSIDVGADLDLWGPEFGGHARIHFSVLVVHISFSLSFGASRGMPQGIPWEEFESSFLPAADSVCTFAVAQGLVSPLAKPVDGTPVVNQKELELVVDSAIPFKSAIFTSGSEAAITLPVSGIVDPDIGNGEGTTRDFGIAPMGYSAAQFADSQMVVAVQRDEGGRCDFEIVPIVKRVPMGLWGESTTPSLVGPSDKLAVCGFRLRPVPPGPPQRTPEISMQSLRYEVVDFLANPAWSLESADFSGFGAAGGFAAVVADLAGPAASAARKALLKDFGLDAAELVDLDAASAERKREVATADGRAS